MEHSRDCVKYVIVTGGVLSGLGKGISTSSIGVLLKSKGLKVCPIKIDHYLDVDAGTMNPYQNGEVFVLDDGAEVDLDLGNYERFLDVNLTGDHNITTGKVYRAVIEKERRGDNSERTCRSSRTTRMRTRPCSARSGRRNKPTASSARVVG